MDFGQSKVTLMGKKRVAFLQGDVTRALKGAKAAGFEAASVEIAPDGRILVLSRHAAKSELDDADRWIADYRARQA